MRWTRIMWRPPPEVDPQQQRSERWVRFFDRILSRRLATSFHAVRLARPAVPTVPAGRPLIVYSNHPSWWDAALIPVLMARLFPTRRAFGPIDAEALSRYPFMRKLGFFGIQPGSYAGAATFLRVGRSLLEHGDTVFCVTPQGSFVDVRRSPRLQAGLAGLLLDAPPVTVLPLAVEYPFWSERTPEALVRFGPALALGSHTGASAAAIQRTLEDALADTMARLAEDAISRDPSQFEVLLQGQVGVGGVYDGWRRLQAWRRGERFNPAHSQDPLA